MHADRLAALFARPLDQGPRAPREYKLKSEHALDIVRQVRERRRRGSRQWVWTEDPGLRIPAPTPGRRCPSKKQKATAQSITVEKLATAFPPNEWTRRVLRNCTRGQLQIDIAHRRVWLWDGAKSRAPCWHRIVRRELRSIETTPIGQVRAGRPSSARLAILASPRHDHHVATLFIVEQHAACRLGFELLTPRDIVEMLKRDRAAQTERKGCARRRIIERHERRRGAIDSRFRTQ